MATAKPVSSSGSSGPATMEFFRVLHKHLGPTIAVFADDKSLIKTIDLDGVKTGVNVGYHALFDGLSSAAYFIERWVDIWPCVLQNLHITNTAFRELFEQICISVGADKLVEPNTVASSMDELVQKYDMRVASDVDLDNSVYSQSAIMALTTRDLTPIQNDSPLLPYHAADLTAVFAAGPYPSGFKPGMGFGRALHSITSGIKNLGRTVGRPSTIKPPVDALTSRPQSPTPSPFGRGVFPKPLGDRTTHSPQPMSFTFPVTPTAPPVDRPVGGLRSRVSGDQGDTSLGPVDDLQFEPPPSPAGSNNPFLCDPPANTNPAGKIAPQFGTRNRRFFTDAEVADLLKDNAQNAEREAALPKRATSTPRSQAKAVTFPLSSLHCQDVGGEVSPTPNRAASPASHDSDDDEHDSYCPPLVRRRIGPTSPAAAAVGSFADMRTITALQSILPTTGKIRFTDFKPDIFTGRQCPVQYLSAFQTWLNLLIASGYPIQSESAIIALFTINLSPEVLQWLNSRPRLSWSDLQDEFIAEFSSTLRSESAAMREYQKATFDHKKETVMSLARRLRLLDTKLELGDKVLRLKILELLPQKVSDQLKLENLKTVDQIIDRSQYLLDTLSLDSTPEAKGSDVNAVSAADIARIVLAVQDSAAAAGYAAARQQTPERKLARAFDQGNRTNASDRYYQDNSRAMGRQEGQHRGQFYQNQPDDFYYYNSGYQGYPPSQSHNPGYRRNFPQSRDNYPGNRGQGRSYNRGFRRGNQDRSYQADRRQYAGPTDQDSGYNRQPGPYQRQQFRGGNRGPTRPQNYRGRQNPPGRGNQNPRPDNTNQSF